MAAPISGSLLERHWGEEKQPPLAGHTAGHGNLAKLDLPAQLPLQWECHCTSEHRVVQECMASRPAPAPEMMLCQPFRHLGDPAKESDSCT